MHMRRGVVSWRRPNVRHLLTLVHRRTDFDATAEWRDMDWVQVRSNQGHASHVLRMDKYQASRRP